MLEVAKPTRAGGLLRIAVVVGGASGAGHSFGPADFFSLPNQTQPHPQSCGAGNRPRSSDPSQPENPQTQQKGRDCSPPSLFVLPDSARIREVPLTEARRSLQRLNVSGLPALGALHNVELHGLTLLQALEAIRVDGRVVHENVFAVLTRDEAEALRVVKPFHSTLFHFVSYFLNFELRLSETERPLAESCSGLGEYCSRPFRFLRWPYGSTVPLRGIRNNATHLSYPPLPTD